MIRVAVSAPLFALAALVLIRSWNPLGNGYFSESPDSPDGLYLTMAAIGITVAALFAVAGGIFASAWFRRHGGLLVLAALAILASALPYVLFKWTSEPETWPWAYLVHDQIGWLLVERQPRWVGVAVQLLLAAVAAASASAHLATALRRRRTWSGRRGRPRARAA